MEEERKKFSMHHIFKLFLIAFSIFAAMFLCAALGFSFVKNSENDKSKDSAKITDSAPIFADEPIEIYDDTNEEAESVSETPPIDKNDYLVILKDGAVKLYLISDSGDIVFSKDLEISPNSLLEKDRETLKEGIILKSEAELFSFLEDFSS